MFTEDLKLELGESVERTDIKCEEQRCKIILLLVNFIIIFCINRTRVKLQEIRSRMA